MTQQTFEVDGLHCGGCVNTRAALISPNTERPGRTIIGEFRYEQGGRHMTRQAGDRYECGDCGSVLRYEKICPCCSDTAHAEVCCDKPMVKVTA